MEINKSIFKSYDVRGIYPSEINKETAYIIGRAFSAIIKSSQSDKTNQIKVVVGRDMRLGSEDVRDGFIDGLVEQGIEVHDIGLVPTDSVYFAVGKFDYDGGAMITASHNPKEYIGIKLIGGGMSWIRGRDLLDFLNTAQKSDKQGTVIEKNILEEHVSHLLSFVDVSKIKSLKIIVDAGNGMAGKMIPLLEKHLPVKITPLFFELDGNFPNHPSNPLEPESQVAIAKKIIEEKADLGAIFDGDSDRVFFFDEAGRFVRADMTLLLIAKQILAENIGAGIAYSLNCSRAVPENIKKMGGIPLRAAVGYVNVSTAMKNSAGIMGGELSAHYSFKDNFYADSGYIAFLKIIQTLSESGKKMSELVAEYDTYTPSGEINFKIPKEKISGIINSIKEKYNDGEKDELDGLTIEYADWWFLVRPSNTEPLLRLSAEADTKELLDEKVSELKDFIAKNS